MENSKLEDRLRKMRTAHREDTAKVSALEQQLAIAQKSKRDAEALAKMQSDTAQSVSGKTCFVVWS